MNAHGRIALAAWLVAGWNAALAQDTASEEEIVTTVRSVEIPAIDRDVPEKLETATFALG